MKILLSKRDHSEMVGYQIRRMKALYDTMVELGTLVDPEYHAIIEERVRREARLHQFFKTLRAPFVFVLNGLEIKMDYGYAYTIDDDANPVRVNVDMRGTPSLRVEARERKLIRFDSLQLPRNLQAAIEGAERVHKAIMTYGAVEVDADTEGRFLEFDLQELKLRIDEYAEHSALVVADHKVVVRILEAMCQAIPMEHELTKRSWFSSLFRSNK
ncbi:hypothetical protein D3C87_963270 [compost metagenome]